MDRGEEGRRENRGEGSEEVMGDEADREEGGGEEEERTKGRRGEE